jgi:hypothetical protein
MYNSNGTVKNAITALVRRLSGIVANEMRAEPAHPAAAFKHRKLLTVATDCETEWKAQSDILLHNCIIWSHTCGTKKASIFPCFAGNQKYKGQQH